MVWGVIDGVIDHGWVCLLIFIVCLHRIDFDLIFDLIRFDLI